MKNVLLLLSLFISLNILASSGGGSSGGNPNTPPPPCNGSAAAAGNTCATATPICDINGYCGSTSNSYGANYWSQLNSTFCGSIENNSFLSFVASSSTISFDVWINSSQNGDGIQIMVFSASGNCSGSVTSYTCYNPGNAVAGPETVNATGLTPGNTYYIMIDGFAGDVANYTIGANSGFSLPVSVQDITLCAGETGILVASGGDNTYTWDPNPELSSTTGDSVIVSPPGPGIYTYTVNSTVTGNNLCTGSTTTPGLATATVTVESCGCNISASNSGPICASETFNLNSTSLIGASFSWSGPNGFSSTDQNPQNISPPLTAGTYNYIVTANLAGEICVDTTVLVVNAIPTISAGQDRTICIGESVTLNGSGGTTYTWDNSITNGVSFNPTSTMTYTVTGTSNGCSNTDQVLVTVNPLPLVNAGPDTLICEGFSLALIASGANSYSWNNNVINGVPFTPSGSGTYVVEGNSLGCINKDSLVVTVSPTPIVSFVPNKIIGCTPDSIVYTNTSTNTNTSCLWNFGNGDYSSNCSPVTAYYASPGCYDVTLQLTSSDGCIGQTTMPSIICISDNPISSFDAVPGTMSLIETTATFINNSTGASSFIWNFDDGSGQYTTISPTHTFPTNEPGNYEVMLIAINDLGCRDTSTTLVKVLDEIIYYIPNTFTPDGDEYNNTFKPIFTSGFEPNDYNMYIYNRWGELIFESHDVNYGWPGTYGSRNSIAPQGAYTWKIHFKTTLSDEHKMFHGHITLIR